MLSHQAISKLISLFKKQPVTTLYIFGSQATGKTSKLSDYDFAVQIAEMVRQEDHFDLRLKLMEVIGGVLRTDKVDVVVVNSEETPLSLRFRIVKEGKVIFCGDDIARSRLEVGIMSEYYDRKFYLDRHIAHNLKKMAAEGLSL